MSANSNRLQSQVLQSKVDDLPPDVQVSIRRIVEKRVNERLDQEMAKFRDYLEFQMNQ
jgi:hypothetical protein